jgi:hypothetical protein
MVAGKNLDQLRKCCGVERWLHQVGPLVGCLHNIFKLGRSYIGQGSSEVVALDRVF